MTFILKDTLQNNSIPTSNGKSVSL